MGKGTIEKIAIVFDIVCGKCEYGEQIAEKSKRDAEAFARMRGWVNTQLFGWICKDCAGGEDGQKNS